MTPDPAKLLDDTIRATLDHWNLKLNSTETANICAISGGVVEIEGFASIRHEELIALQNGSFALALNISDTSVSAALLDSDKGLKIGGPARRTQQSATIPVGSNLKGRILDPLCRSLDRQAEVRAEQRFHLQRPAPPILDRSPVRRPLETGIKAIDATIPIGRGQRQLILGDRQTGKTSLAVDTILNQPEDVTSIYCAIGQRQSSVAKVIKTLRKHGALERTIIVVASGEDPPGLQYLAPYAATSIAEYFMVKGEDTLVIYDDLTCHARAYRELSLLLRRPPGREAYPGDIFYLHARLLERATQLRTGGSITALPIIETQAETISAYIPTNLISITDGQLVLSRRLFEKGHLPAIDIGKSVSRVGGKAQLSAYRSVSANLRLHYAQFEELDAFARFGTRIDQDTKSRLERGRRVRELLKQNEHDPQAPIQQIAALLAATNGLLDPISIEHLEQAEQYIQRHVQTSPLWQNLPLDQAIPSDMIEVLNSDLREVLVQARLEKGANG